LAVSLLFLTPYFFLVVQKSNGTGEEYKKNNPREEEEGNSEEEVGAGIRLFVYLSIFPITRTRLSSRPGPVISDDVNDLVGFLHSG